MKNFLFLVAGATVLSLSSCSHEEKTTEVTTTTPADSAATVMTDADMNAMVETRAQRIADQMVADMKITDEGMKTKIRTVYVNRGKRMGEVRNKYKADTAGMAAAMRDANMETDTEFKSVFTDPTQYQSYESSRMNYDESKYMDANSSSMSNSSSDMSGSDMSSSSSSMDNSNMSSADGAMSGGMVEKSKTKMTDGSKVKVKDDGTVKVKDADGKKTKM